MIPLKFMHNMNREKTTGEHQGKVIFIVGAKELYLRSKNSDKRIIAMDIVEEWRGMNQPGRSLKEDVDAKLWNGDVGNKKAREKMSLALRSLRVAHY